MILTTLGARPRGLAAVLLAATLAQGAAVTARAAQGDATGAPDPATPLASAVLAELDARPEDDPLRRFYADRGGAALWLAPRDEPAPAEETRAAALLDALGRAGAHALPPARYDARALAARLRAPPGTPEARARLEIALGEAYLRYARDVSSGLLVPRRVDSAIKIEPRRPDPHRLLRRMSRSADPRALLAGLAPDDPGYARLKALLARLRAVVDAGGWGAPVAAGPTIGRGDAGPRVAQLRDRLRRLGDLPGGTAGAEAPGAAETTRLAANEVVTDAASAPLPRPGTEFDAALEAAVKRFQARHGLNQDGLVGPATLAALNTRARTRLRQTAVNLERMRWLNRPLGRRHVRVNLADFRVSLVEAGRTVFTARTVVGRANRHETPEFSDEIEHMVVNPEWHVPASIARNEILPELKEDPGYLASRNMRLEGTERPASMIDWQEVPPGSFPGRVTQAPGDSNALGRVKFMFPNRHSIYLHDTPSKHLFARDRRAYSHGCIRVQDAFAFAHALLAPQADDPEAAFARWLESGRQTWVHLEEHVPVHITYRTVRVAPDGTEHFRADIYGRDRTVAEALRDAGVTIPGA